METKMADEEWHDKLDEVIDEDSRARRSDPLTFVAEVVEPLRDSEEDGFLEIWRSKSTHYRWYADDAMYCFDRVIAEPPHDLVERLRARTGFSLNHVERGSCAPYTHDDVVAWLRNLRDKMRVIYDETAPR
jgi:hypothetical protein